MPANNRDLPGCNFERPVDHLLLQLSLPILPGQRQLSVNEIDALLAASEVATATLTLYPGSEMLEGDLVQVAVEGYVDGELVGGIIMEHNTPSLTPRAASYDVYLPVVLRQRPHHRAYSPTPQSPMAHSIVMSIGRVTRASTTPQLCASMRLLCSRAQPAVKS
ncbi:MAG: hypothetical protein BMS9Abin28_0505 [Anaerolineae bacterium]|nr:MAG: hypothetical protein BMS9Abin28_0505 [Anaerolineae bacterium]